MLHAVNFGNGINLDFCRSYMKNSVGPRNWISGLLQEPPQYLIRTTPQNPIITAPQNPIRTAYKNTFPVKGRWRTFNADRYF